MTDIRSWQPPEIFLDWDDPAVHFLVALGDQRCADRDALQRTAFRYQEALVEIEALTTKGGALSDKQAGKIFKTCIAALRPQ